MNLQIYYYSEEEINMLDKTMSSMNRVKSIKTVGKKAIPLWKKYTLSVDEASVYFRIGDKKLRKLIEENPNAEYLLWNGSRPLIKRRMFEKFVDEKLSAI